MANVVDVKNLVSDGVGVKEIDVVLHAVTVNGVWKYDIYYYINKIYLIIYVRTHRPESFPLRRSAGDRDDPDEDDEDEDELEDEEELMK